MPLKIKKILYATDLSESARYAFGYAADLADKYEADITILYVIENLPHVSEIQVRDLLGAEKWEELKQQKQTYLTEKIRARVEDFCTEMSSVHDSCRMLGEDIRIQKGNPQEVILETSQQMEADLIVMGTHGYNILKDALIGGTARKVVQKSKIPVLVIRLPEK